MKKKFIRLGAGMVLFAIMMIPTSCELGDDCAWCTLITDNDGAVTEGIPLYYCDEDLYDKQSQDPIVIGTRTTYWDCD